MPVIDILAEEYSDRIDFVAPAWKADFSSTSQRAKEILPSGKVMWGLDEDQSIFELYGVPYQPVTVLIAHDRTVFESWPGLRSEADIRNALESLIALSQ